MKLLSVLLVGLLLCHGGSGKPFISDIIGSITKGINKAVDNAGNIISEAAKGWGDITNGIITKASDASIGAIKSGVKFVTDMANGMTSISSAVSGKFTNLSKSVDDTMRNVGDDGGETFKTISRDIKGKIDMVRGKVEEVLVDVDKKYNEGLVKLNETLLKDTKKIDEIVSELRDKCKNLNEQDKEKIEKRINEFIFASTNEISQCSKEIVEPLQGLYNDTIDSVNGVLPTVQKVVDDLEKCVKDAGDARMKLVKCGVEAKKGLPTISTMDEFIENMRKEVEKYNFEDLIDLSCVEESWKQINKRKNDLEKDISKIVENS